MYRRKKGPKDEGALKLSKNLAADSIKLKNIVESLAIDSNSNNQQDESSELKGHMTVQI